MKGFKAEDEEADGDGEDEKEPGNFAGLIVDAEGVQAESDSDGGEGALEKEVQDEGAGRAVKGSVIGDEAGAVTNGQGDATGSEGHGQPVGPSWWRHGGGGAQNTGGEGQGGEGGNEGDEEVRR